MFKEFRDFINRGNVIDLAVAVVIGAAFSAVVNSLVEDVITPIIGIFLGGINFEGLAFTIGEASITYGNFIQSIINFLIIAWVVFLIVRGINQLQKRLNLIKEEEALPPAEPSEEVKLLTEIRDLLREKT
jgi:large conductance mechanosensitive channel